MTSLLGLDGAFGMFADVDELKEAIKDYYLSSVAGIFFLIPFLFPLPSHYWYSHKNSQCIQYRLLQRVLVVLACFSFGVQTGRKEDF